MSVVVGVAWLCLRQLQLRCAANPVDASVLEFLVYAFGPMGANLVKGGRGELVEQGFTILAGVFGIML